MDIKSTALQSSLDIYNRLYHQKSIETLILTNNPTINQSPDQSDIENSHVNGVNGSMNENASSSQQQQQSKAATVQPLQPIKSRTMSTSDALLYAQDLNRLCNYARSMIRDIDPSNDLQLVRINLSDGKEIMSTVDADFRLIVVQDLTHSVMQQAQGGQGRK